MAGPSEKRPPKEREVPSRYKSMVVHSLAVRNIPCLIQLFIRMHARKMRGMKKPITRKSSKITVSVWRPVWSKLEKKLDAACLNRDAYLSALVDREVGHLQDEMPIANSEEARQFINKQLRVLIHLDTTPLSIALSPDVAARLNAVCEEKRVVRDAFFNRLFLFLAFGPRIAGLLLFRLLWLDQEQAKPERWTNMVWSEYKHDGPFFENVFEPFVAHQDPLWPIRACFELIEDQDKPDYTDWTDPESGKAVKMAKWVPDTLLHLPYRFYTVPLTDRDLRKETKAAARPAVRGKPGKAESEVAYHNLYGLNCYLPNFMVPGHLDKKAAQAAVDNLLVS